MATEEQRISCTGTMTTPRRKDHDHTGALEAILYNLTIGSSMNLDDGCRGDGGNQHPQITVSIDNAKGFSNGSYQNKTNGATSSDIVMNSSNGSKPISQYLQVPEPDLSKLTVMPCHEYSH